MDIFSQLESEFGDAVFLTRTAESDAVDGAVPQAVAAPRDEEAAQALVAWCGRENIAFVPRGGGTKLYIGAPPSRCDLIISTEKLTQIFDHDEGNATVQAGAGITIEDLGLAMSVCGQFVPLVPLSGESSDESAPTLGGVIATNDCDGTKLKYGAPRDLVTGLSAVLSDGRLVKAGAKVVKNVAGYDLNKLFVGSFGTLGLITQVTVRLRPEPAQTGFWMCDAASWEEAVGLAGTITSGAFEPTLVRVFRSDEGCSVRASFEGEMLSVENQLAQLPEPKSDCGFAMESYAWFVRAQLPLQAAPFWASQAWRAGAELIWDCALGTVRIGFSGACDVASLRAEAEKLGGFLIVEKAPHEVKTPDLVWGRPRGDFALMQKLKQSFDAANVCAPGRFVGGI